MRVLAALLLLAGCNLAAPDRMMTMIEFRQVTAGDQTAGQSAEPRIVYASDENTYRAMWNAVVGEGSPPAIDFSREAALILTAGETPTGGYRIEVKHLAVEGDVLAVNAPVVAPPAEMMVTQVITHPYRVIAVKKTSATRAEWRDQPRRHPAAPVDQ